MQSCNSCQLDVADLGPSDASDLDPDGAINEVNDLGVQKASNLVSSDVNLNPSEDLAPSEGGNILEVNELGEGLKNRLKDLSYRVMNNILSNNST